MSKSLVASMLLGAVIFSLVIGLIVVPVTTQKNLITNSTETIWMPNFFKVTLPIIVVISIRMITFFELN